MARSTFGGTVSDFVFTSSGGALRLASATLTFWTAKNGGTQVTDLVLNGNPTDKIPVGTTGQIPPFQGPDGVTQMWVSAGGDRSLLVAPGTQGPKGDPGPGIPTGGSVGQVLVKSGTGNGVTEWRTPDSASVPDASVDDKGKIAIATAAETGTGTNATKAVTPATLKATLDSLTITAGTIYWEQVNGTYPDLPATKPAGVKRIEASGVTSPPQSKFPSWAGNNVSAGKVPIGYSYWPNLT